MGVPIYEFRCLKCNQLFEKLFLLGARQQADMSCPHCGSETAERVMSQTNYSLSTGRANVRKPSITTKSCSPGNSCTSFEIPGPQ